MATTTDFDTFADVLERLGKIPASRVLLNPVPGTATEDDVTALLEGPNKRLCELIDGVLVEKAVGTRESLLAGLILQRMWNFVEDADLGLVLPGDGALRLMRGLIRFPDVCFIGWDRLPNGFPDEPIASLVPHLAVEVISEGNTKGEMQRKLKDYFITGVELVWFLYPKSQTAEEYSAPDRKKRIGKGGTLDGGDLLPGFTLSLSELFARSSRKPKNGRKKRHLS